MVEGHSSSASSAPLRFSSGSFSEPSTGTRYRPSSQLPRSCNLQRSEQKGKTGRSSGLVGRLTGFSQLGQDAPIPYPRFSPCSSRP